MYEAHRRLPFERVVPFLADRHRDRQDWLIASTAHTGIGGAHKVAMTTVLADVLRVNRGTTVRWSKDGIPEPAADRIACALDRLPQEIWPEWDDDLDPWDGSDLDEL